MMHLTTFIYPLRIIPCCSTRSHLTRAARSLHSSHTLLKDETNDAKDGQQSKGSKDDAEQDFAPQRLELKRAELVAIPDENPLVPKEHVFQEIKKIDCKEPIFTIEAAAEPAPVGLTYCNWKYPSLYNNHNYYDYLMRGVDNEDTVITCFPEVTDFLCIGAGLIGSATAYYTKKIITRVGDVLVFDRDPYGSHNCTAISHGLISAQSKNKDASRLATLTKELLRNLKNEVLVTKEDFAKIKYRPCIHLVLWPEGEVDEVIDATNDMISDGCYVETKLPDELERSFPFLKACDTDIAIGTHGLQDEAIIDPLALRNLYRSLAQAYGASFVRAEVIDFNTRYDTRQTMLMSNSATACVARNLASGELRHVGYAKALLCLGHETPFLEARAETEAHIRDQIEDLHFIQPKMRIHFCFQSLNAPMINFPAITDTDGSVLIKEDYLGNFKYYLTYDDSETLMDVDYQRFIGLDSGISYPNLIHRDKIIEQYFVDVIKPKLVNRIPLLKDAKFNFAMSGFESCNTSDKSPVVGPHPWLGSLVIASGFGPKMAQYSAGMGAILAEHMVYDEEKLYDITSLYWNRVIKGRKFNEFGKLMA